MSEPAGDPPAEPAPAPRVGLAALFTALLGIGASSFGGGVIAYLRNVFVVRRRWVSDDAFMSALEISEALPGLNATNMSVVIGERIGGWRGAVLGMLGMTLPGAVVMLALAVIYASHRENPTVAAALRGIGAASVGLLAAVTLQIGRKQLGGLTDLALACLTVVLVSVLHVSLAIVLLTVGPAAIYLYRPRRPAAR